MNTPFNMRTPEQRKAAIAENAAEKRRIADEWASVIKTVKALPITEERLTHILAVLAEKTDERMGSDDKTNAQLLRDLHDEIFYRYSPK